ncbi:MAG: CAP domain-containing protein [Patescibacteria group bacterium]|jgi:hypothetical protein
MPRKKIGDFEDLKRRDSDGDGLSDYDEIFVYHSDPLSTDSSHDGLNDFQRAKLDMDSINYLFMKDFFIPNKNNNFKPHILKTRRIFFYSLSAVLIKILVVGFVFVFPVTAWLTPDFLKAESKEIVTLTNTLRQSLDLQPLRESEILQAAAFAKAEDMVVNQYFAHVSPEKKGLRYWLTSKGYNYQVAGENLAIGYSAPAEVIEAWKNSPTHYANLVDPDYNEIGVAMIAGQYQEFDTKLVAQMFGFQKTSPMQEVKPVEPLKTLVSTTTEPTVLSEKSVSVVIPKDIEPLAKPQITTAIDNLLTKEGNIDINILAPEAEQVVLFVNDNKQSTSKVVEGQATVQMILDPGMNKITVQAVLGQQLSVSQGYLVEYDDQAPTIDEEKSFISAIKSTNNQAIVKIEAVLSADTKSALVRYHGFDIALKNDDQNNNLWTGHRVVQNVDDQFFSPVVPATIVVSDLAGNITTQDLAWQKILLDNQSALNQYLFIKNTDSNSLRPIFDISAWYYKIMILVAVIALLLNIFIEIRKQHLKTIASTMGFIGLLALLILF